MTASEVLLPPNAKALTRTARTGILVRQRQDVYLARVSDVRLRRGPLQTLAGSGDIRVTAGPDLTLTLRDVPSARLLTEFLGALTEHPEPRR